MGYKIIKEEKIPLIEGYKIGNKHYLFKNIKLRLTEKELIFAEDNRSYKYTIRLPTIYKLELQRKEEKGKINYKIQVNDFGFYGDPEWFKLIKNRINQNIVIKN